MSFEVVNYHKLGTCPLCGAVVAEHTLKLHEDWHEVASVDRIRLHAMQTLLNRRPESEAAR